MTGVICDFYYKSKARAGVEEKKQNRNLKKQGQAGATRWG
jgi:hypothetical protein